MSGDSFMYYKIFIILTTDLFLGFFNSGEYVDTKLIDNFEEKYDCKVVYETYDSKNHFILNFKVVQKYDIVVPSELQIERLIKKVNSKNPLGQNNK
mgnify:CR=1 FL=1